GPIGLVSLALSCGRSEPRGSTPGGTGGLAARVDGRPIFVRDVADRARADGVSSESALARLVDEELLFLEARRRGIAEAADIVAQTRKLVVQRFLEREIEDPVRAE